MAVILHAMLLTIFLVSFVAVTTHAMSSIATHLGSVSKPKIQTPPKLDRWPWVGHLAPEASSLFPDPD